MLMRLPAPRTDTIRKKTVKTMLRSIITDKLLKKFSYKGQKSKKVFSVLATCFLIFDKIIKYAFNSISFQSLILHFYPMILIHIKYPNIFYNFMFDYFKVNK